ncbi:MAG TPA: peptidoglycan DD-metalloendopeptidase family protein [Candidatus Eisenbacteria bacterium]|nr:peptidoglycan DD-metalloendopeptidase family protein [Candidatus Eisenbacteria bacterium]
MLVRHARHAASRALGSRILVAALVAASLLAPNFALVAAADDAPVAGAFVYPVGDELDYTKGRSGEGGGFYVSDEYLATRNATRKRKARIHRGVDLANGRGGAEVRSIASGVVVVADANALIKYRKKQKMKLPKVVNGKRVYVTSYRYRTGYKWRTGWGNYVVVRHTLPNGETIHSLYGHLAPKSVIVKRGDVIAAGQPLGKVGRTGRASSAHLHLEVRKALPVESLAEGEEVDVEDEPTVQERSFAKIPTVDPLTFLEAHVRRFEDLDPGTWQARYALAAARDGIIPADRDKFEPDAAITRADYFRALVSAFGLATPFTKDDFSSSVDALVDAGILDAASSRSYSGRDNMKRDEALELLLRCLERGAARARTLGAIKPDALALDFNRQFAGDEAARAAIAEARAKSEADYRARQKQAAAERARLARAAKAKGKPVRVKSKPVKRLPFIPPLDPGFEALAKSTERLTRAESCLLFASALRLHAEKVSALQKAASRVPTSG